MNRDELVEKIAEGMAKRDGELVAHGEGIYFWRAKAALQAIEAAGFALVPVKLTDEMLQAGERAFDALLKGEGSSDPNNTFAEAEWEAMIAASPLAKESEG